MTAPLLELLNISKNFGTWRALHDVSLSVYPGEIVGLLGDNGAGKSTLVKLIAGNFVPTSGVIKFDGNVVRFRNPAHARSVGIEVVYQDLALADNLTAVANIFLGREITRRVGPFRFLDHGAMKRKALRLFAELRSENLPDVSVKQMSGGQRQAIAVARTRLVDARMVIMDEPTASISVSQVKELLDLLCRLKKQGVAIILVSHRMLDVFSVCDRVIVMRRGEKKADKLAAQSDMEEMTALLTGAKETA